MGESELLPVVWELEIICFYLNGKLVYLYTDHQALEPLIKRNRAYRQYSARLTRWLYRLAHFDISIKYTAGKKLKTYGIIEQKPNKRTVNRQKVRGRICYQYPLFSISHLRSTIKDGPKNSNDRPITENGFNDELRVDQWNRFIEEIRSGC